ncbi:alpha/beta hydrolase [Streptacidiphilus sp. PAMC 29251]
MTTLTRTVSPGVREISLHAAGTTLSALLAVPEQTPPRATVVALHGSGMSAGYFDGQAHPDQSLLTLGAALGFTVLAVDRPGYGRSAAGLPYGQNLGDQACTLRSALKDFGSRYETGAGLFLLAHSFGGKLALTSAAATDDPSELLGLDISGCGHRYAVGPEEIQDPHGDGSLRRNWGALRLYPPNTFQSSASVISPLPARERREAERWQQSFGDLASCIRVPVRFTFAEHEHWWHHDEDTLADLRTQMPSAPRLLVERQQGAGHNISLGWAARPYHLRALGFLEDCLLQAGA